MEKNNFTRRVAEGGLLVSLAFLFYFIAFIFPVLAIVEYLSITPIIAGIIRHDVRQGINITVASSFLVGLLIGPPYGLLFFLTIGIVAMALGTCLKKNFKTFNTILISFFFALISMTLGIFITMAFINDEIIKELIDGMKSLLIWICKLDIIKNLLAALLASAGLNDKWMTMEWVPTMVTDLLPSLLIIGAFYYVIYLWIFNVFFLKRLKIPLPDNAMLGEFPIFLIIPAWSLLLVPAGIIFLLLNVYIPFSIFRMAGENIIVLMGIVGFAKGVFSINTYLQTRMPAGKSLRFIISMIITFLEFTVLILPVVLFGFYSIASGRDNSRLYEFLGTGYLKAGKLELAVKNYKRSLDLTPHRPITHKLLAIAYQHMGKRDLAASHLKMSLELSGQAFVKTS